MGDSIRKLIYIVIIASCLFLGILGLVSKKEGITPSTPKQSITETINCSIVVPHYTNDEKTESDYSTTSRVTIVLTDGTITSKIVNESIVYKDKDKYTARKGKLLKAGANYTFDDDNLKYEYKKSLEQSLIEGADSSVASLKEKLTSKGYECN